MGPCALVGAPISLGLKLSVPAAFSTLGLAQGGTLAPMMIFPSFWCRKGVCLQTRGLDFCFFACFYSDVETVMRAYCYNFLFHEETKLCWSSQAVLGIYQQGGAWVNCMSAGNPLSMPWRKGGKQRY